MNISSRLLKYSLQAVVALPLMFGAHASAIAAPPATAATTTLDVCHDEATGNWRYSGMVAVSGASLKSTSSVGVDVWVQNSTSPAGYVNALRVPGLDSAAMASPTTARWSRFSVEAAPLSLGVLRNSARIAIADPFAPTALPLLLHASADYSQAVCGCPVPAGCTHTQGYWKSKPGVIWPAPYSRDATFFFSSGLTWQQILDTPPRGGDAYLILAHQYIAAVLNRASGATAPSSLQTVINNARTWFMSGTNLDSCSGSECETQKNWAGLLDTYNNGLYPGAPSKCAD